MTNSVLNITINPNQAQALVDIHDSRVKDEYKLNYADKAYLLTTSDYFEENLQDNGCYGYELKAHETLSGHVETIEITLDMVDSEWVDLG